MPLSKPPVKRIGRAVLVDFGIKENIVRIASQLAERVVLVDYRFAAAGVLAEKPDLVLLGNGPGDPNRLQKQIAEIKQLVGKVPLFGICLGCQLMGLALGGMIQKLKFGHHGTNHPVLDRDSGEVLITSQNHNYALTESSMRKSATVSHTSLYDQTVEGFYDKKKRLAAVQFHPEAAPGPHDASTLVTRFLESVGREDGDRAGA